MSNHGALVTSASIEVGQHFGKRSPRGTYLLGVLENQAFYRVETNEGTCYANGPAGKTLGGYCPVNPPFPSPSRPVLAAASVSADKAHRATILGFAGFAADGVARVDFVGKDGYTTSAAIHNNIFNLKVAGQLLNGSKLVFKDRSGKTVYTQQN
jgi:hypothetical protein